MAFSSPGFFGISLILSVVGSEAVFYINMCIAILNLLQWSYGVSLLKGEPTRLNPSCIIKSPYGWTQKGAGRGLR